MYAIYANIGGILMVNVTISSSTMDPMGRHFLRYILDILVRGSGGTSQPLFACLQQKAFLGDVQLAWDRIG